MEEFGVVKFFDEREGKKFGFLSVINMWGGKPTGEEIFFHYNDRRSIHGNPFSGKAEFSLDFNLDNRSPRQGDQLVFERALGSKGRDKASPWDYAEYYGLANLDMDLHQSLPDRE